MNKKGLILASILLATMALPTYAKTTVTPYIEVEANDYEEGSEKQDLVIMGVSVNHTLSDKATLSLNSSTTDYDFIGDDDNSAGTTAASSRVRTEVYFTNQLFKGEKGSTINLKYGIRHDENIVKSENFISYRVEPIWSYPISKTFTVEGDWLFTKDKTDKTGIIGDYCGTYELITGVKYTGIPNYTLTAQVYNYLKDNLNKSNHSNEVENQLRAKVSTKIGKTTISPWVRMELGKYKFKDSDGNYIANSEKSRNRYGLDLSRAFNNVTYATSIYFQPTDYTASSVKDENQKYIKVSATYSF